MSDTTKIWPPRLRYSQQCDYLREKHGLDFKPKTITNRVCAGTGPQIKYIDGLPYSTPAWLDRWVDDRSHDTPHTKKGEPRRPSGAAAANASKGDAEAMHASAGEAADRVAA